MAVLMSFALRASVALRHYAALSFACGVICAARVIWLRRH